MSNCVLKLFRGWLPNLPNRLYIRLTWKTVIHFNPDWANITENGKNYKMWYKRKQKSVQTILIGTEFESFVTNADTLKSCLV